MAAQATLDFSSQDDLARFNIPGCTAGDVRYGHVSRHLRALWRHGRKEEAADLAKVAGEVFKTSGWTRLYPAQRAQAGQKGGNHGQ